MLALPGSAYVYQGEELGLWEVEDMPDEHAAGPDVGALRRTDRGRDGCRVPLPWSGDEPPFGFSHGHGPWLPQPAGWRTSPPRPRSGSRDSMLELYRAALTTRQRSRPRWRRR